MIFLAKDNAYLKLLTFYTHENNAMRNNVCL
jgi:hypothetical protein